MMAFKTPSPPMKLQPAHLPAQLMEVLRDTNMSCEQMSTYYAVKYRTSLSERLRHAGAASLLEYLGRFAMLFEIEGQSVRCRSLADLPSPTTLEKIRYADTSKGIRTILEASPDFRLLLADLEVAFEVLHGVSIISVAGMPTSDYLRRKPQVFGVTEGFAFLQPEYLARLKTTSKTTVPPTTKTLPAPRRPPGTPQVVPPPSQYPQVVPPPAISQSQHAAVVCPPRAVQPPASSAAPASKPQHPWTKPQQPPQQTLCPMAPAPPPRPAAVASEPPVDAATTPTLEPGHAEAFTVRELASIFEDMAEGPIMHSSVLCSLFMQRHGTSVSDVTGARPTDLCRRHPEIFLWLSSGNIALAKNINEPAVQAELRLLEEQPKSLRVQAAAAEAKLPVPEVITEEDVVEYMRSVLLEGDGERASVYISKLCGRFMQRFRQPMSTITRCRPTDFLKRHKDVFYLEKGGHVRLVAPSAAGDAEVVSEGPPTPSITAASPPCVTLAPQAADLSLSASAEAIRTALVSCMFLKVSSFVFGGHAAADAGLWDGLGYGDEAPVVAYVPDLPTERPREWLPSLLRGLRQVLTAKLGADIAVDREDPEAIGTRCQLRLGDEMLALNIHLVPASLLHSPLTTSSPNDLAAFEPALLAPRLAFLRNFAASRFCGSVACQLAKNMKRWAREQPWSSTYFRPSSYLLELLAVHSACKAVPDPSGASDALAVSAARLAAAALCDFHDCCITWQGLELASFEEANLPAALLRQRPLLLDPVMIAKLPINVGDTERFDCCELVKLAGEQAHQLAELFLETR